jgi:hypothetical protein
MAGSMLSGPWADVTAMPNLRGLVYAQVAGWLPAPYVHYALVLFSLALLGYALLKWTTNEHKGRRDLDFALLATTAVLVGYHLYLYDLSLMLLPIALVLNRLAGSDGLRTTPRYPLGCLAFVLLLSPIYLLLVPLGQVNLLALPLTGFWYLTSLASDPRAGAQDPGPSGNWRNSRIVDVD